MEEGIYYPEYTYKIGKSNKCTTAEVLTLKHKGKIIAIITDLTSINPQMECKTSVTNSIEYFIVDFFNKLKKENPDLSLKDFVFIEHYYERDNIPESYDLVIPVNTEFNEKGFLIRCKPHWINIWIDDLKKENRTGTTVEKLLEIMEKSLERS